MHIVGIKTMTGEVFESQSYQADEEIQVIITAIQSDAIGSRIEVSISEMTDEELQAKISSQSVD